MDGGAAAGGGLPNVGRLQTATKAGVQTQAEAGYECVHDVIREGMPSREVNVRSGSARPHAMLRAPLLLATTAAGHC